MAKSGGKTVNPIFLYMLKPEGERGQAEKEAPKGEKTPNIEKTLNKSSWKKDWTPPQLLRPAREEIPSSQTATRPGFPTTRRRGSEGKITEHLWEESALRQRGR